MLNSAPSFSIYNPPDGFEDLDRDGSVKCDEGLVGSVTIGDSIIDAVSSSGDFSFVKKGMGSIEEGGGGLKGIEKLRFEEEGEPASPPMYLATGLGIDAVTGFSNGVDFIASIGEDGGDVEEHYKKLVEEFPCHPLLLRNYAQLLQSKGDLSGAEQYYYSASLAEPGNGEILMLYANLVWELHRDKDSALNYFKRAAEAAPHDSHVLAAYARFLWEIDDDEEEDNGRQDPVQDNGQNEVHDLAAAATAEECYTRLVEGSPCNSLFVKDYSQALSQLKGDLQKTEEYYLQTMLMNPGDGEIMTQYAKMVWEIHRDQNKALSYFEWAIEASPEDSHVLAAYASFLWQTEDDEDQGT